MKLTLTIQIDNAAFTESASAETARILRHIADRIVMVDLNEYSDRTPLPPVFDVNGNRVGTLEITQ